jgi:multicomponent Na+:H+ antiporter subunit B
MNIKKYSLSFIIQVGLALVAVLAVIIPIFLSQTPWPVMARDYLENNGFKETGAINLVSAIYLGFRAFDTLGETIVLLVAISGTISIISHSGITLAKGFGNELSKTIISNENIGTLRRTELVDVVTSKLGPIVLLFGFYVMLYGHLSPGGGFQGGVVIASGIVFISLGSKTDSSTKLQEASVLSRIEAVGFLFLIMASISGIFLKTGFLGNPLLNTNLPPVSFIIILNIIIGLKVGAGIGYMCVAMLGRKE